MDIDLPWGAVTAIAGPNGAGKSTLIEILAGVREPAAGTVERAGDVALVVQRVTAPTPCRSPWGEVVMMGTWGVSGGKAPSAGARERRSRVAEALGRVQLEGFAKTPFGSLSGGQRQRVLLAQGIARRAHIFLLDEPTAGLDVQSRERTRAMLAKEARRGAAVACVSHDEESIAAATCVVRLEDGRRVG